MVSIQINFDFTFNIVSIFFGFLTWIVIVALAYRVYKKQSLKPKVWKVVVAIFAGLFSFSINWNMLDTMLKLSILPLGVWILYFVLKRKRDRWERYRNYAWLGFGANFIILIFTLITILVHNMLYPKAELSTYISNVEHAAIINIHPSAEQRMLLKEGLTEQLSTMSKEAIYSDQWYQDTFMHSDPNLKNERFPYMLVGASSKWGSGLQAVIYVERDGKGILLSTPNKQHYFRSEQAFLKEVE